MNAETEERIIVAAAIGFLLTVSILIGWAVFLYFRDLIQNESFNSPEAYIIRNFLLLFAGITVPLYVCFWLRDRQREQRWKAQQTMRRLASP